MATGKREQPLIWGTEGIPVEVTMERNVVRRIAAASDNAEEQGGFLLGSAQHSASGVRRFHIDDIRFFDLRDRISPAFALARDDRPKWASMASRLRKSTIGFFRTHARPGLYLDQRDFALIQDFFPSENSIFLIARGSPGEETMGGFFFWENGDIHRQTTYAPFSMGVPGAQPEPEPQPAAVAPAPVMAPVRRWSMPDIRSISTAALPLRSWKTPALVAAGAALVIGLPLLLRPHHRAATASPVFVPAAVEQPNPGAPLLQTDNRNGQVRVRWNPADPRLRNARAATLWIRDGRDRKRLDLDSEDLRAGGLLYVPRSKDVQFQMDVNGAGAPPLVASTKPSAMPVTKPESEQEPPPPYHVPPAAPPKFAGATNAAPEEVSTTGEAARTVPEPQPATTYAPPAPATQPVEPLPPAYEPPRPVQEPARVAASVPAPRVEPEKPIEKPKPRGVTVHTSVADAAARDSGVKGFFGKLVGHEHKMRQGDNFVPPRPVHQVSPVVPDDVAREMKGEVPVELVVKIDKHGHVQDIEANGHSDERLVRSAKAAVSRWTFSPARINDNAVASEMVLHLRFRKGQS